jgi:hypothetical protein
MWIPLRLKTNPSLKGGWYYHDLENLSHDLSKRFAGKQAAQKACDRKNNNDQADAADLRMNTKRWYTIGYVDRLGMLLPETILKNPVFYHGYLSRLKRELQETMQSGHIEGAIVAVIWSGQLSRTTVLYSQKAIPLYHVFADGRITGSTG